MPAEPARPRAIIVTGTDTGIGKTVFSAMLTKALDGVYFKPVQAGLEDETDTQAVRRMTQLDSGHFAPEIYKLNTPASPHRAAELDGIEIDPEKLTPPAPARPLIVEGAGGLMVPVTRNLLQIDLFARWQCPLVLCARTSLGTINHTLLSLEALKARAMTLLGVAFIGDGNDDTERVIIEISGARRLGRLPWLDRLDAASLTDAFDAHFTRRDFIVDEA